MRTTLYAFTSLALLGLPATAAAQGTLTVTTLAFNGRAAGDVLAGEGGRPISAAECAGEGDPIALRISGFQRSTTETQLFDIWRSDEGTNCADPTNRVPQGSSTTPRCTNVGMAPINESPQDIALEPSMIFGDRCAMETSQTLKFWFFLASSSPDTGSMNLPYGTILIGVDTDPPDAATNLDGGVGDTQIPVSWTNPSADVRGANVYIDPEGCPDGVADPMGALGSRVGMSPEGLAPVSSSDGSGVNSATINGSTAGLEVGAYAAVAVTVRDAAGNESVLSEVTCVQRIEIEGALHDYCRSKGFTDADGGADINACLDEYSCTIAAPGASGRARLVLFAMIAIALGWVARRAVKR